MRPIRRGSFSPRVCHNRHASPWPRQSRVDSRLLSAASVFQGSGCRRCSIRLIPASETVHANAPRRSPADRDGSRIFSLHTSLDTPRARLIVAARYAAADLLSLLLLERRIPVKPSIGWIGVRNSWATISINSFCILP